MNEEVLAKLYNLFDELNKNHFDGVLPPIALRFTGRLKTSGGQYIYKPLRLIQISTRYFEKENPWQEIRDTLGHEMVHYWLDFLGLPCGHTPLFRKKLKAAGFSRYSRLIPKNAKWIYECPGCKSKFYRKRRARMSCGSCSGRKFNSQFELTLVSEISFL